ncbi:MAG: exodeoxyribonuclease VII large subunit, partial [Acidithiobacillus ferrooxidans]
MTSNDSQIPILTVSALNAAAREIIEGNFPLLRVEGELSNFSSPGSGHWYFSLKDARAQVRCAMFRQRNTYTRVEPRNGMQVQVLAQPTLYEGRGDFQLIVEQLLDAGVGDLQARFVALRDKLAAEGLFAPELKRPLPRWPQRVAVVTSASGAALHDIQVTLARRWPMLAVMIYPVLVQGDQAAAQICTALTRIASRQQEDVVILARGGGSAEDLWCFNEESVARAIRACPVPVVTGIGHEIDFTIADFAGDLRAATPTAAAEAVSPDRAEWLPRVQTQRRQLEQSMQRTLRDATQRLDYLRLRLRHPGERVRDAE